MPPFVWTLFRHSRIQYFTFYEFPLLISFGVAYLYIPSFDFYVQLNVIVSIFVSVLLTTLSILGGKSFNRTERVNAVLEETCNAIIFDVCLCLFLLGLGLIMIAIKNINIIIERSITLLYFYLFQVVILTLLLIFKRLGNLINT